MKGIEELERMYELAAYLWHCHGDKLNSMTAIERGCVYYNIAKKYKIEHFSLFETVAMSIKVSFEFKNETIDDIVEWVSKGCPKE